MARKLPKTEHEKPGGAAAERRRVAQKIAERLFTNGAGQRATRLELKDKHERDMGGWCFKAAVDQIKNVLGAEG